MRKDVQALINFHREETELLNKSEIARRMNCDRRTVDKYINNPPVRASTRQYISALEPFKEIIINKVDTYLWINRGQTYSFSLLPEGMRKIQQLSRQISHSQNGQMYSRMRYSQVRYLIGYSIIRIS